MAWLQDHGPTLACLSHCSSTMFIQLSWKLSPCGSLSMELSKKNFINTATNPLSMPNSRSWWSPPSVYDIIQHHDDLTNSWFQPTMKLSDSIQSQPQRKVCFGFLDQAFIVNMLISCFKCCVACLKIRITCDEYGSCQNCTLRGIKYCSYSTEWV